MGRGGWDRYYGASPSPFPQSHPQTRPWAILHKARSISPFTQNTFRCNPLSSSSSVAIATAAGVEGKGRRTNGIPQSPLRGCEGPEKDRLSSQAREGWMEPKDLGGGWKQIILDIPPKRALGDVIQYSVPSFMHLEWGRPIKAQVFALEPRLQPINDGAMVRTWRGGIIPNGIQNPGRNLQILFFLCTCKFRLPTTQTSVEGII